MRIGPFKLSWLQIEWGQSPVVPSFWFYYFGLGWHSLGEHRWGLEKFWYDGPHCQLSLGPLVIMWSTQWTTYPTEDL